jgi:hypothetical protein
MLCRFSWCRCEVASAKRTLIETGSSVTHQQGYGLALYPHLGANNAAGAVIGRVRAEETCPLAQPLVKSVRAVLPIHWRGFSQHFLRKASDEF